MIDNQTNWRALGSELHYWVIELAASHPNLSESGIAKLNEITDRTSASLSQPEPEGPTDSQLDELFIEIDQSGKSESWRLFARAVLARWGK